MQEYAPVPTSDFMARPGGGGGTGVETNSDLNAADERQRAGSVRSFLCTAAPRNSITGQQLYSVTVAPNDGNDGGDYRAIEYVKRKRGASKLFDRPEAFAHALTEKLKGPWIEQVFLKRECIKYIPTSESDKCGCGLSLSSHSPAVVSRATVTAADRGEPSSRLAAASSSFVRWNIAEHTKTSHTDAFGTLEFSGGTHAHKAHYVRLGYDSDPADIMYLMEKVWCLEPPRLVITVHGGISNFEVQDKLGRVFREGLLKAAQTTGAWIITAGIDAGVVRHVATALDEAGISARMRSKVVTIGIAPWGLLKRRDRLIGKDIVVPYDPHSFSSKSKYATLNDRHSYFLLVDNGTSGRYGADIILRKRLEEFIAQKQTIGLGTRRVPVVCAVLEGGTCTIRAILQYLANEPPVPVIVCDGSGRASDIIAFAYRHVREDGSLPVEIREQLLTLIASVFRYSATPPQQILEEILCCTKRRDLLTVFRLGENRKLDVDHAILCAMLKGQNLSAADQLALTLVWNRVDIARSDIFVAGQHWPAHLLHNAMMEALALDRVDFVKLLLENGVSMKKFLTISRLEQLYNMEQDSILPLVGGSISRTDNRITLPEIGVAIERLMGNAYKCPYTSRKFKNKYEKYRKKALISRIPSFRSLRATYSKAKHLAEEAKRDMKKRMRKERKEGDDFQFPFNDLMVWAVLSRRQEMALCMWTYGEEAMAKALAAVRLYKKMSKEVADEYIEVEVSNELREFAEEFKRQSVSLLNHCYQQDDAETLRMLTAELPYWGHHTCLSLAVISNNRTFLAQPCCQILLADLWHGGLCIKSYSNLKVILALAVPPCILLLDVKARISSHRMNSFVEHSYLIEADESDYEKDDENRSQSSACSSVAHAPSGHAKNRRKIPRKSTVFSRHMTSFFGTANLIEETLRAKSGFKPSRKSTAATLQEAEELTRRTWWTTKVNVFYSAPITTFWMWLISYFVFLGVYTYVILIEFPVKPSPAEWFLLAYVVAFAVEHFRKVLVQEASTIFEKIRIYFDRCWNYLTFLAIVTFFIGFTFRYNPSTRHSLGRVIQSCNIVFWYIKLLDFMGVHPRLGPYIQMTGKMIVNMMYILALLLVTLMAFGISRQAITYPHEKWHWLLVRNIFYKPYFMLYGEVYAGEIDTCGDEGINCVPGGWITPIFMTIFLLVANILLINMLIAIFNNIFNETNAIAQQLWLFQRYEQVMEYENTPFFPPPFTPISHLFLLLKYFWKLNDRNKGDEYSKRGGFFDFSMKLRLNDDELRLLHDFEEDCMDDLSRKKSLSPTLQTDYRLLEATENSENLKARLGDMVNEDYSMTTLFRELELRLDIIEKNQRALLRLVRNAGIPEKGNLQLQSRPEAPCGSGIVTSAGILDKKGMPKKAKSIEIFVNVSNSSSSDDEVETRKLQRVKTVPETGNGPPKTSNVYRVMKRRPLIRHNEAYTSITDTIEVPVTLLDAEASRHSAAASSSDLCAAGLRDSSGLQSFEEPSDRITSGILGGRVHSSTWSISEDLMDMSRATKTAANQRKPTSEFSNSSSESSETPPPLRTPSVLELGED